jgi:superfamily I DNA and/or RNA helicase
MFSLSNTLAYGGMMVQGRGEKPSSIRDVLGHSAWIDVKPDRCEDKWSAAEGRTVIELFRKLDRAGLDEVDIYLISPFRIVAQKLRELLIAENALSRWTKEPRNWVKEHVGTVYTVQGREADTVIMVLGAAEPQRRGARNWAGQDVNQLNVAVTRARENLYVIGNRFEWASAGKFEYLERQLT